MSYAQIKPQYYQMHMPDSPWHAGSEGWKSAPWPSFGVNPNLVGPPRLAVEGLGAYFKPVYERPINGVGGLGAYFKPVYERPINGLGDIPRVSTYRPVEEMSGFGACPCRGVGLGTVDFTQPTVYVPIAIIASITGLALYVATRK
jgi:hypothetical protein